MKKNILLLINGFGVERADSYSVYSAELMPNMDRLTRDRIFVSLPNNYLEYKSAYRNFSMGINDPLTYTLIENSLFNATVPDNQVYKYILAQVNNLKSRLHIICYWDSDKTVEQLITFLREIERETIQKIFVHLVLCQNSLNDYKQIDKDLNTLNYDVGANVKIGVITGEDNLNDLVNCKDLAKCFITEFGEKWKDLSKKIEVQIQTRTIPRQTRTFSVTPTYRFEENDQVLVFNYSNIDITKFRNELYEQKFRQLNFDTIPFYSLFPIKAEKPLPFMYNFAVSANYTLNSLNSIKARCLVMDSKDKCSFINYYLTGLRNEISDSLKYLPTDDGFIYDPNKVLDTIKKYDNELYIINYEIDTCRTFEEMQDRLRKIDAVVGALDTYIHENNMSMFITSFYGLEKMMYNAKQELLKINFSGRVPLVIDDDEISLNAYNINEGSLYDLCNSVLWNINKAYTLGGIIKKKSKLLSFLYKKPKANNMEEAKAEVQQAQPEQPVTEATPAAQVAPTQAAPAQPEVPNGGQQ